MCKTPVIHIFHVCNSGVYPTHGLHVKNYMCSNVYTLYMYYMCTTCVLHMYLHAIHVIHLYVYKCNTPERPHMYYRCSTTGHSGVDQGEL